MNPSKFKIKKPRITLSEEQKNQARAGMAGEAVKASEQKPEVATPEPVEIEVQVPETTPLVPEVKLELQPEPVVPAPLPMEEVQLPTPEIIADEIMLPRQRKDGRVKKAVKVEVPEQEDSETQHVRMSKDTVLKAKMNILLLPRSVGIKNLRDYGDAAFAFYEAHLRKTGKLPG